MDHGSPCAPGSTKKVAQDDDKKTVMTIHAMLSKEVAKETASFVDDASRQLCSDAMRVDPLTPAATSLREYHFKILMKQAVKSYAEGRGQDFADDRFAIHDLLQEEPQHQPLAERFCRLMGLWLQEAHNKQQEKLEWERRLARQWAERKMKEEQEKAKKKAENKKHIGTNDRVHDRNRSVSSNNASKQAWVVCDEAGTSPPRVRVKTVFDLAGLIETDESSGEK